MSDAQIANDLKWKICAMLNEVMQRETKIAQVVLPASQVTIMEIEIAAMFATMAITIACGNTVPGTDTGIFWDLCQGSIEEYLRKAKPGMVSRVEEMLQARKARAS